MTRRSTCAGSLKATAAERRRALLSSAALALLGALVLAPGSAPGANATRPSSPPCRAAGAEVLARTAGVVAERIYAAELHSAETFSDKRQIETYEPLLAALQSGDQVAVETAVHWLVYSHTHIVRLRVSRGSQLLADIGGPYIIAPIAGTLRSDGRTLAQFVFSVQDDLGYVKLVTRFLGLPLVLRTDSGQVPVEGLLSPGPGRIPDHGAVSYRGRRYQAYSFDAEAYPSGRLRVSLIVPVAGALARESCERIVADELRIVAQRISRRFELSQSAFAGYIQLVETMTHGLVYVREGSRTLAASTHQAPKRLPSSGALRWHGVDYEVSSFRAPSASGTVDIYLLLAR
jgi:hypothetical protein